MKAQEIFDTYKDCIMPTYTKVPLVFVKGKGSRLWDIHNRGFLDFFPGDKNVLDISERVWMIDEFILRAIPDLKYQKPD